MPINGECSKLLSAVHLISFSMSACTLARSQTFRLLSNLPLQCLHASMPFVLFGFAHKPFTTHLSTSRSSSFLLSSSLPRTGFAPGNEGREDEFSFQDSFESVEEEERIDEEDRKKPSPEVLKKESRKFPILTSKEKKELRAYAHGLGKKLVSQQVGKAGVTSALVRAISDTLEANEILKLRVLDNCPDELEEVTKKIEEATQAQMVGKIGSTLLLYRPSLRKLNMVEKQQKNFRQRQAKR